MGISINQMVTEVTKVDILAIGVHPDDVELSCSGTILKHIQLGYTVGLLDLTLENWVHAAPKKSELLKPYRQQKKWVFNSDINLI